MKFTPEQLKVAQKQMYDENIERGNWARKAAKKLSKSLFHDERHGGLANGRLSYPNNFKLCFQLCQYDNWDNYIQRLENAGVVTKKKSHSNYLGRWDLSNDPDFADSPQKVYQVVINYYDAHASGW